MEVKEFSLTGFSADNPLSQETDTAPAGYSIKGFSNKQTLPTGVKIAGPLSLKEESENAIRSYLSTAENPEDESAKIDISHYYAQKLGVSFDTFYSNYDKNIETILGRSIKPKEALQLLSDSYTAAKISTDIDRLANKKANLPIEYHEEINREIERLRSTMPVVDPFEHNAALDWTSIGISMVPYIQEVGKWAIPGMALSVGAGFLGGPAPAAATVVKTVGSLVSIWGKAKSFQEGYTLTRGSLYQSLSETTDENGEPIDDAIARKVTMWAALPIAGLEAIGAEFFLTGNSVFKSLVSKIGEKAFKKRIETAAAKTVAELTIKGFYANQAKLLAKGTGVMVLHEIAGEEIPQEIMTIHAEEMAKHLTNDLKGTEFEDITSEAYKERLQATLVDSFKGMFVLGLGRTGLNTLNNYRQYTRDRIKKETNIKAAEQLAKEDERIDAYTNGTDEEIAILDEEEEAKVVSMPSVSTKITTEGLEVKVDGKTKGTAEYTIDGDTLTVHSFPVEKESEVLRVVNDIKRNFKGFRIAYDTDLSQNSKVIRALEDSNEDMAIQNEIIDETKAEIKFLEKDIEANTKAIQSLSQEEAEDNIAALQAKIEENEQELELAIKKLEQTELGKLKLAEKIPKPVKNMTAKEYNIEFPLKGEKRFINTEKGKEIKKKLDLGTFSEEEKNIALDLVDVIAAGKKTTATDWVDKTFEPKIIKEQDKGKDQASVDITTYLNGEVKSIIKLVKESNITAWVHELGHILRTQLSEEDYKIALKYAEDISGDKAKNGVWTDKMEDAFAQGFERYISEGITANKGIKGVFKQLAEFMTKVYKSLKHLPEISDDIRKVFENQLSPQALEMLQGETRELFQPKYKEAIEKAVSRGEHVSEDILEQFDDAWAKKALEKIKEEEEMIDTNEALYGDAIGAIDEEDFIQMEKTFDDLDEEQEAWYRNFYKVATRDIGVTDVNTGNKEWAKKVNTEYARSLVEGVSKNIKAAKDAGVPGNIIAPANRFLTKNVISDKALGIIVKTLKNNPGAYREIASEYIGDMEEVRKVEQERELSNEMGIEEDIGERTSFKKRMEIADQLKDEGLKQRIKSKAITGTQINKIIDDASKKIDSLKEELAQLEKKMQEDTALDLRKFEKIREIYAEQQAEIKRSNKNEAKLEKQVPGLKDTLKSAKEESKLEKSTAINKLKEKQKERIDKRKDIEKKLKEKIKLNKEEALIVKNTALKALREKQKEKDALAKIRKDMIHVSKQIKKEIPGTVDATYRKAIKILQDSLDPHFRSKATLTKRQFEREFHKDFPEMKDILSYSDYKLVHAKALNEWTLLDLEILKGKIDAFKGMGITEKEMRDKKFDMEVEQGTVMTTTQLYSNGKLPEKAIKGPEEVTLGKKAQNALLKTFRPSRVLDMMDAGKGFKGKMFEGPITRFVTEKISSAYNNEVRATHNRRQGFVDKMKELKLKENHYLRQVKMFDMKFSIDYIMDVYMGYKNENKRTALESMGIDQTVYDEMVSHLSEAEIALADYLIEDYQGSFEGLREATLEGKNIDLPQEENYSPMIVVSTSIGKFDPSEELLGRRNYRGSKVKTGASIARVQKGAKVLQLGAVSTWHSAVTEHEHYIHNARTVKLLTKVFGSNEVRTAAREVGKSEELSSTMEYFRRYANPMAIKSSNGWDRAARWLKNNSAIAYLAYSVPTIMKQPVSLIYFLYEAGPADLFGSIFATGAKWGEYRARMDKYSPEISYGRSYEAFVSSLSLHASSKGKEMIRKMGATGLKGIEAFDKGTVTIGWNAVFNKNVRKGVSEKEAARLATRAVLHTQPAAGVKDSAELYATDNMLSVFLQFSNQLNQIFNMVAYDIPQSVINREIGKAMAMSFSYIVGSGLIWIISNRRLPQDDEDAIDLVFDSFLNIMPGAGKTLGSYVDGYDLSVPVLGPIVGMAKALQAIKGKLNGKELTDKQNMMLIDQLYEAFAIGAGIPYTEVKRFYKVFFEGETVSTAIWGGEWNDKQ